MTTRTGKGDLLFGYGIAFGAAAAVQAVVASACAYLAVWADDGRVGGPGGADRGDDLAAGRRSGAALLGVRPHRIPGRAMLPVVVIPQILLCGLFVPRDQMAGWLSALSTSAAELRGRGAAAGRCERRTDVDVLARSGRDRRLCDPWSGPGGGHPAAADRLTSATAWPEKSCAPRGPIGDRRRRPGPAPRQPRHPAGDPGRRPGNLADSVSRGRRSARSPLRPASTPPWCTTISAPRRSCSWPPSRYRRPTRDHRPDRCPRRRRSRGQVGPHDPVGLGFAGGCRPGGLLRTALADPPGPGCSGSSWWPRWPDPVAASLDIPEQERELRTGLVMTQVLGLIVGRYLLPWSRWCRCPPQLWRLWAPPSALPDRSAAAGSRPAAAVPSRRTGMSEACRANNQHPRVDARRLIRRRPGGVEVPPRAGQAIDSPRSTWTRPADPRDGVDMSKFHHSAEVRQAWDLRNLRRSQVGRRAERGPE